MIKKSLLILALAAAVGSINAQSLRFEREGTAYANNQEIVCDFAPNFIGEIGIEMQLRNLTDRPLDVMVGKEYIHIVEGTSNTFCWGLCFGPDVMECREPKTVAANSTSLEGELSFHYQVDPTYTGDESQYIQGTSVIRYYAYPIDNPEDKTYLVIRFKYDPTSIVENLVTFGEAYPNPASNQVSFDVKTSFNDNITAVVYNLLGQEVKSCVTHTGQSRIKIDVTDLQPGIYFCSFYANGEVLKTEKFIVKR